MRIMLVHNRYRSNMPSGENKVVDQEAQALTAAGHEVIRFEKHNDDIDRWPLAKKAMLPARVFWSQETHRELTAGLRAHRPDVVHIHNTFPLVGTAALRSCRTAGVPVVATIHNYRLTCASGTFFREGAACHDCAHGSPLPAIRHGCYRESRAASVPAALAVSWQRPAWRSLVSAYVFISAAQRDLLGGLGLPRDRSFVRHNMIPRRDARQVRRDAAVVYAGRLAEVKGLRLLMAAWDEYRGSRGGPGLRLVIAGAGPLEDEVAAWASARPSVELAGQVDSARCAGLMAAARAVIVPSVWEEPFGLVVVEAMAVATPVIAAAHASLAELITPGVDGTLFAPGDPAALADAIFDADTHPDQYEAYGEQARKTYEQQFDPQRSLEHLLDIYRFAIDHPVWRPATPGAAGEPR
jgi:glycosyltransferase involved in cell wall biosynthesis